MPKDSHNATPLQDDDDEIILNCSIYAKMDPEDAYKKLKTEHARLWKEHIRPGKLWLLRESRQEGCLSIDYLTPDEKTGSGRFALVRETPEQAAKWTLVNKPELLEKYASEKKIVFMNMETYYQQSNKSFCNALFSQLEEYGFLAESYLEPTRQEKSRNKQYASLSKLTFINHKLKTQSTDTTLPELSAMLDEVKSELKQKKEETCPISFSNLQEARELAIVPQGEIFEKQAVVTWLANNPSCPITRAPLNKEGLLISQAPDKTKRKLKEVEKLMEKQKKPKLEKPEF